MNAFSFSDMRIQCHDSRSCNKFLKDHGISGIRFQSVRKCRLEPRHMFEVKIYNYEDHEYKRIFIAPSIGECIKALKFYYSQLKKGDNEMRIQDVKLNLNNINYSNSAKTVKIVGARLQTDQNQVVTGCNFDMVTAGYSRSVVKTPLTNENRALVEDVQKKLLTEDAVTATLLNPSFKLYAMLNNGNLFSGVSIKADTLILDEEVDLLS